MAKKKKESQLNKKKVDTSGVMDLHGSTTEQPISETLELNYMPYAMSVIVSRAIPEIDGFKPSHRKLLYTMYKMGLLTGGRTKSANIVGQTMKLNPHGDAAIYETMVRLARGMDIPLVVTNDCHYLEREDADAQEILMCIQTGKTLEDENRMRFSGTEFYVKSGD